MDMQIQRIDHLGIIAGVIKDLKIVELIDQKISKDKREEISTGEAIAGMIINGLGFSDRPLSLTPQFFESKAMETLFREGVEADHFNRFKLGRALDDCFEYGCDQLFSEISFEVCKKENVDCRFNSEDTTTFSLTGEYDESSDEHVIEVKHGYSKDHRPDLKQVVLELMVSQDGGVPLVSKSWDGNASDSKIFRERAKALIQEFKKSETPRYLVADSKLYCEDSIDYLKEVPFVTRIPATIKLENEITKAAIEDKRIWQKIDEENQYKTFEVEHYGIKQRWIVVQSQESIHRAEKRIQKAIEKEKKALEGDLKKLIKQKFHCREDALENLAALNKKRKFHQVKPLDIISHKHFKGRGKPKKDAEYEILWQIQGEVVFDESAREMLVGQESCYVIGSTALKEDLSDSEIIIGYKGQNSSVEKGFRFLKDPLFFVSSLFIKKSERIMGLLMVMTLALLIYSIAQRRLRHYLKENQKTLPNQIKKEINQPTLRWVFQMMEGINAVILSLEEGRKVIIHGLNNLRKRIIDCFGFEVAKIYQLEKDLLVPF
jgi:transposase